MVNEVKIDRENANDDDMAKMDGNDRKNDDLKMNNEMENEDQEILLDGWNCIMICRIKILICRICRIKIRTKII